MQIDLPDDLVSRVRLRTASTQGLTEADVIKEALDLLEWADEDNPSDEELARSLQIIDRSMADLAAGRVLSVAEARQRSLDQLRDLGE
jgi:hypothetical protein